MTIAEQIIDSKNLKFLCEQKGTVETELKNILKTYFQTAPSVKNAFLIRGEHSKTEPCVLLCLDMDLKFKENILTNVAKIFSNIFVRDQFLDILIINKNQKHEIQKIAKPFYSKTSLFKKILKKMRNY